MVPGDAVPELRTASVAQTGVYVVLWSHSRVVRTNRQLETHLLETPVGGVTSDEAAAGVGPHIYASQRKFSIHRG